MLGHVPGDQVELLLRGDLAVVEIDLSIAVEDGAEGKEVAEVGLLVRALLGLLVAERRLREGGRGRHHLRNQDDLLVLSQLLLLPTTRLLRILMLPVFLISDNEELLVILPGRLKIQKLTDFVANCGTSR